jgi:hypothetical protein
VIEESLKQLSEAVMERTEIQPLQGRISDSVIRHLSSAGAPCG